MSRPWSPVRVPTFWLLVVSLAIGSLGAVLIMGLYAFFSPVTALVTAPLLVVYTVAWLLLVRYLDQVGRRPWWLVILAFAWGATVSILFASFFNWFADNVLAKLFSPWFASDWGAAITAPIGEEIVKGAGVALLILAARPHLRTVFSGAVYGAIIGIGFTIVEDVTYALTAADDTLPDNVAEGARLLVLRFLVPGAFGHPFFTALVGAGVAYFAIRTDQSRGRRFAMLGAGFGIAALAHAAVNAPLGFLATTALDGLPGFAPLAGLFLVVGAPSAVGVVWLVRLRRTEAERLTAALTEPAELTEPAARTEPAEPTGPTVLTGPAAADGPTEPPGPDSVVATADEAYILASARRRARVVRQIRRAHGAAAAGAARRVQRAQLRIVNLPAEPPTPPPAPVPAPVVWRPGQLPPYPQPAQMPYPQPYPGQMPYPQPYPGQVMYPGQVVPYPQPGPVVPHPYPVPAQPTPIPPASGGWPVQPPLHQPVTVLPPAPPPMPTPYPAHYPMQWPPVPYGWQPVPMPPAPPTAAERARTELAIARDELARLTGSPTIPALEGTPAVVPGWLTWAAIGLAVLGLVHWSAVLLAALAVAVPLVRSALRRQTNPRLLSWATAAVCSSGYIWLVGLVLNLLFPGEI